MRNAAFSNVYKENEKIPQEVLDLAKVLVDFGVMFEVKNVNLFLKLGVQLMEQLYRRIVALSESRDVLGGGTIKEKYQKIANTLNDNLNIDGLNEKIESFEFFRNFFWVAKDKPKKWKAQNYYNLFKNYFEALRKNLDKSGMVSVFVTNQLLFIKNFKDTFQTGRPGFHFGGGNIPLYVLNYVMKDIIITIMHNGEIEDALKTNNVLSQEEEKKIEKKMDEIGLMIWRIDNVYKYETLIRKFLWVYKKDIFEEQFLFTKPIWEVVHKYIEKKHVIVID